MSDPREMSAEDTAAFAQMANDTGGPEAEIADDEPDEVIIEEPSSDDDPEPEVGEQQAKADDGKQKTVPHQALHEERTRRQDAEKRLREAEDFRTRMEERFRVAQEMQQRQEPEQDPKPDRESDPFGYMAWLERRQEAFEQKFTQTIERQEHQSSEQQRYNQFLGDYSSAAKNFAAKEPTFVDAYNHLSRSRAEELMELGLNEQQAIQQMQTEERETVWAAMQQGKNPAEVLYKIAQKRGYQTPAPKVDDAAERKVQTIARGQTQNRSLSQAGGTSTGSSLSMEDIANMPMDQLTRWMAKPNNMRMLEKMQGKGQR